MGLSAKLLPRKNFRSNSNGVADHRIARLFQRVFHWPHVPLSVRGSRQLAGYPAEQTLPRGSGVFHGRGGRRFLASAELGSLCSHLRRAPSFWPRASRIAGQLASDGAASQSGPPTSSTEGEFFSRIENVNCSTNYYVKENVIIRELEKKEESISRKRKSSPRDKHVDADPAGREPGPPGFRGAGWHHRERVAECHLRFPRRGLGVKSVLKIHVSLSHHLIFKCAHRIPLFCVAAVKILSNFYCQENSE